MRPIRIRSDSGTAGSAGLFLDERKSMVQSGSFTPTRTRPIRSASWRSDSLSKRSVFPASTAATAALASRSDSSVRRPITGTSNRMSCLGLATFTKISPSSQKVPARRMQASVPSTASNARTTWSLTQTVCPRSNPASDLAIRKPNSMSFF